MRAFILLAVSLLVGGGVFGCESLQVTSRSCDILCGVDGDCPSGMSCSNGFCERSGETNHCALIGTDSGGTDKHTDAGAPRGETGMRGVVPTRDASSENPSVPDKLEIRFAMDADLCTGHTGTVRLEALGGAGPYTWTVDQRAGYTLSATTGSRVDLSGIPTSAGDSSFEVTLTDASGAAATQAIDLAVHETPQITTRSKDLPPACVGQSYSAQLAALGGDTSTYRWSAAPSGAVALDASTGTASASPKDQSSLTFTATVSDGHCASDPAELTIQVDPVGPGECPAISPDELPDPCEGSRYPAQEIRVVGGGPSPVVEAVSLPRGYAFGTVGPTLSSDTATSGTFVVQVTDSLGHAVHKTYTLSARPSCWLAYLSTETGKSELRLFDPALVTRRDFAAPTTDGVIADFAFSPDGRHLAYRSKSTSGASQLFLLTAPAWTQEQIAIDGVVSQYAWSLDSRALAVSYAKGSATFLGGVVLGEPRAAGDAGDAGAADGGSVDLKTIAPVAAPPAAGLVFNAGGEVLFHAPGPYGTDEPFYGKLVDRQWTSVQTTNGSVELYSSARILPAGTGFLTIDNASTETNFQTGPGNAFLATDLQQDVADPQGLYGAAVSGGANLQLFPTGHDAYPNASATSMGGCASILSWAPGTERIACEMNAPTADAALDIFDVVDATTLVPNPIQQSGNYVKGAATGRRRAFSPSGDWFALTTDAALYVADLSGFYHVHKAYPGSPASTGVITDLTFSPDEKKLLWQQGASLIIINFQNTNHSEIFNHEPMETAPACGEDFTNVNGWCGDSRPSPRLAWSPDSRFVSARTKTGKVQTYDTNNVGIADPSDVCTSGCGVFSFQP